MSSSDDGSSSDEEPELPKLLNVPDDVEIHTEFFENAQELTLQAYHFMKKSFSSGAQRAKGIVWLNHGYGCHALFEFLKPAAPGLTHNDWTGTLLSVLVEAGYVVLTLDHQSHGRSEGLKDLRCYFEDLDHLAEEALDHLKEVLADRRFSGLPVFVAGLSMGGATTLRMCMKQPDLFRGSVLFAPMISLEEVKKKKMVLCIRNGDLKPIVNLLHCAMPTKPIGKAAKNTLHPKSQQEFDEDPLTYSEDVRVSCAKTFSEVTDDFLAGGLREMKTPFITYHSCKDTFTDPYGSEQLLEMADVKDKTYVKVGKGLDLEVDIWHAITTEPGCEVIIQHALNWLTDRS